MPPNTTPPPTGCAPHPRRIRIRTRAGRLIAGSLALGLSATSLAVVSAQYAGAATPTQARSAGNFLDATLGGNPIDDVAKLKFATAAAPGAASVQNPLNATALNAVTLPLTGDLQLPQIAGITLGAANQVAVAKTDGYSYGAAGAVANSGGASVGGDNSSFPADATIHLDASSLAGNSASIPGVGSLDALGAVTASVGAVSALAQTPSGVGKAASTSYAVANLDLTLSSPALGRLLTTLTSALNAGGLGSTLTTAIGGLAPLPGSCSPASATLPALSLEGGAVTINPATATISVDLEALLQQLGLNLNTLPANTDLIAYLVNYLTSPTGLARGLQSLIGGVVNPLSADFTACAAALNAIPALGPILTGLITTVTGSHNGLESAVNNLVGSLSGYTDAAGDPLAPIGTVLKKLIDIGVNVQPNGAKGTFTSALAATVKQGTPVVAGQSIVRAIEIDLVGDPLAVVALANAAAGPSAASTNSATPGGTTPAGAGGPNGAAGPNAGAGTALPTGVPAGFDKQPGRPELPVILLVIGLVMAGGGALAWRVRLIGSH
jgi:hypothetical protein